MCVCVCVYVWVSDCICMGCSSKGSRSIRLVPSSDFRISRVRSATHASCSSSSCPSSWLTAILPFSGFDRVSGTIMPSLNPPRPPYIPPNWPPDVHYLVAPFYGHLPPPVLALVQSKTPPPPHKPNPNVEIRMVTNPAHPACGQRGLFAKQKIKKGELIIWCAKSGYLDSSPAPSPVPFAGELDYPYPHQQLANPMFSLIMQSVIG